jgi:hypothetical protein
MRIRIRIMPVEPAEVGGGERVVETCALQQWVELN